MAKREAEVKIENLDEGGAGTAKAVDSSASLGGILDPELLGDVTVELSASLGRSTISLAGFVDLKDGALVPLDTPLNGLVELTLNGRIVARGELVSLGDNFAVRLVEVVVRQS